MSSPHEFEFLLFDGFSNMVLASALEPLRDVALRRQDTPLSWRVATLDGSPATSSSGVRVTPDGAFGDLTAGQVLVLVSGYGFRDVLGPVLNARLRRAARGAKRVLALDTAGWLLASAGLLNGHKATVHWQELDAFAETFAEVDVQSARFVRSGKYQTCGGASTALDMILDLIGELFGAAAAFEASTMFVYDLAQQAGQGRGARKLRETGSPTVLASLNAMAEHIETPLTTFELAHRVGVSERTLNRTFARELGITPGKYYQMFRLQRARSLAEETHLSSEQIALRCGFSSASSLGRAFVAAYDVSIKGLRTGLRAPQVKPDKKV